MKLLLLLVLLVLGCAEVTAPRVDLIACRGLLAPAEFSVFPNGHEVVWQNRWQQPHRTADTIALNPGRMIMAAFHADSTPRCLTLADSVVMHMPEDFWKP